MAEQRSRQHTLDGPAPRVTALAIAFACLLLMTWLGRENVPVLRSLYQTLTGAETAGGMPSSGNPELDACLEKRLGDVTKMVSEGIVTDTQAASFKSRATSYCETQFPRGN
ncbi:hypothetical protein [Roseibium sp.]|uniref:hypothetical protein n=1 Tax=Roseibium sp. TaxID=1936156 RepID=UPI003A9723D8